MPKKLKALSKNEQLENCLLALSLWSEVKPRSVSLDVWKCGTLACFGGHLATWPEFQAKGVFADSDHAPALTCRSYIMNWDIAKHLFGNDEMFSARGFCGDDLYCPDRASDHTIVVNRLQTQIARLSE